MARAEAALAFELFFDQAHQGLVSGDIHSAYRRPFRYQVDRGGRGQMHLESFHRLIDQGHAVGQEQNALHPISAHQHVDQRNHGARLPGAGGHFHQGAAAVFLFKRFRDAANGAVLVVALHNGVVDLHRGQQAARPAALYGQFQFVLFIEPLHFAGRVKLIVPQLMFVAIGEEDERALAVLFFQTIGIELGLLLARCGVALGAFGFHHTERFAVVSPEDVIGAPFAFGHSVDWEFAVLRLIEWPAGFPQHEVYIEVARFGFGIIVRVGLSLVP